MNNTWLWDLEINDSAARRILSDPEDPRFIRIAALMLARVNDTGKILGNYISPEIFCRNWAQIKKEMRKNRWDEPRIIWWQAIYEKVYEKLKKKGFRIRSEESGEAIGPLNRRLGNKVRSLRRAKEMSQAELAERMGTSQQWISLVERGKVNLTLSLLERIAGALETDLTIDL